MLLKNKLGFTLVEVMIAAGIAAGIGTVVMQLTKETTKTTVKFQSDVEATEIANEIMGHLADPLVCSNAANLGNKTITGFPGANHAAVITQIQTKTGANIYSTANTNGYGPSRLVVSSYDLSDTAGDDVSATGSPREMYLLVNLEKKQINKVGTNTKITRKIKIAFETNTNNTGTNVAFCRAVSMGYDAIWQRNGSTSEIFYNQGFVGIGTGDPDNLLHVQNTATTASSVTALFMQPNQPNASLQYLKYGHDIATNYNAADIGFFYNSSGSASNRLDFGFQGVSSVLAIRGDGFVGVNNTAPNASMDVNGGVRARGGAPGAGGANNNGYAFNGSGDSDSGMFSSADGQLEFYNNNAETMRLTSAGSVGIGTTSPTYKLEVNGSTGVMGDLYTGATTGTAAIEVGGYKTANGISHIDLHAQSGSDYDFRIIRNAGPNGIAQIVNQGTGSFTIGSNGGTALTIDSSNNITSTGRIIISSASYPNAETDGLTNAGGLGIYANDVATKKWVAKQINEVLANATAQSLNGITANLANYGNSNMVSIIKEAVCNFSRVITNSTNYNGSWSGGYCNYTIPNIPPDCRFNGSCATLYATNMYATTVWANSFCANASGGSCLTRTDRMRCPDGYLMYGIANGFPQCKQWGVTTPTIPSHTTTPFTY